MLFREIVTIYVENHTKPIIHFVVKIQLPTMEEGGTYRYHWGLKG